MDLKVQMGSIGGLSGSAPVRDAGQDGPGTQPRQRRVLTSEDRAVIAAGLRRELSYAQIGELIGRDKSVVYREVNRNRGPDGSYWAPVAHRAAHERRRRPKEFRLAANPGLCRRIEAWMDEGWSPRLIARVLHREHPSMIMDRVSHETIYQALYVQGRDSLRQDLHRQLSTKRAAASHGRARRARDATRSLYREAFTISQRPPEVEHRAVPGHWEGDLVLGTARKSAVGMLVERTTRFVVLLHLPGTPRRRVGGPGHDPRDGRSARASASVADLGPRQRAGPLREDPARARAAGLLLRPPLALATRVRTRTPTDSYGTG